MNRGKARHLPNVTHVAPTRSTKPHQGVRNHLRVSHAIPRGPDSAMTRQ